MDLSAFFYKSVACKVATSIETNEFYLFELFSKEKNL